ncbi:MAG: TRAP transporter small permease subunit [bacterium]
MIKLLGDILIWAAFLSSFLLLLPLVSLVTGHQSIFRLCQNLSGIFESINKSVAAVAIWAILAMVLIQFGIVILRYVFGVNFIWLQESVLYFFAISFLLMAGYVLLCDEHVRVDLFYRDASLKYKAWVDIIGTYLFLFPICILIIWAAGPYVARSWAVLEPSGEPSGIPAVFLLKSLIPAFALLLAMAGFVMATNAVRQFRNRFDTEVL